MNEVDELSSEIVRRHPDCAVDALQKLWNRHVGYGRRSPLREQVAVVSALDGLPGDAASRALRDILLSCAFPAGLLELGLEVAVKRELKLPKNFLDPHLVSESARVRELTFALAQGCPQNDAFSCAELMPGLTDPNPAVTRQAAVTLGEHGCHAAKPKLLALLARSPGERVLSALAGIADDDIIVHIGGLARRRREFRDQVAGILVELACPRADADLR